MMYSIDGLPYQPSDRQYLIITDDEDDFKLTDSKGYQVRELIFSVPFEDLEVDITQTNFNNDLDYGIEDNVSCLSMDIRPQFFPVVLAEDNGFILPPTEDCPSKTTQTHTNLQDQGVNTSTISMSISTQTPDEQLSLVSNSTSTDSLEAESNLPPPKIPLTDPKLIIFANKMAKVLRVKPNETSRSSSDQFSENHSVIYTYSLDKSKESRSFGIDYNTSRCSSTSYDELRSTSGSDRGRQIPSTFLSDASKDNEIMFYLNQECQRFCYLPNEILNQGSAVVLWEFCKVYELKKFDEIIKSHINRSDRRLKAISNRLGCKIEIIGPYKPCVPQINARNLTEWYKLAIYSSTRLRLEKSINCIQLSFPSSCFNEKMYKPYQSQNS